MNLLSQYKLNPRGRDHNNSTKIMPPQPPMFLSTQQDRLLPEWPNNKWYDRHLDTRYVSSPTLAQLAQCTMVHLEGLLIQLVEENNISLVKWACHLAPCYTTLYLSPLESLHQRQTIPRTGGGTSTLIFLFMLLLKISASRDLRLGPCLSLHHGEAVQTPDLLFCPPARSSFWWSSLITTTTFLSFL